MSRLFEIASSVVDKDNKYTTEIKIPQYTPSAICPNVWELCDLTKYYELMRNISISDIPEDVKKFLSFGATRHIVFNYSKIADYYAHAEPEIQRLMEQSALVIIDLNDAIANGYVKLSQRIKEIMQTSGEETK